MPTLAVKEYCTGCTACASVCPKGCITMAADEDGFLFPVIDAEKCISCGKCAQLCPLNNIQLVDGKPRWGSSCTQCMACICRCPQEAIEYGRLRIFWVGIPYLLCGIMEVLTGALRGLGSSITPAVTTFIGTCGFRIIWVMTLLPLLGGTIEMLFLCWPVSWVLVIVAHSVTLHFTKKKALNFS